MRRFILILLVFLMLAIPSFALEESRLLTDLQILQVEKWEAELRALVAEQQLRQVLADRTREQFNRWVGEQGKGCKLDMEKRQWAECPTPKSVP